MQKLMQHGGEVMVGRDALLDTMYDLIIDLVSAALVGVFGYFSLKAESNLMTDADDQERFEEAGNFKFFP